MKPLIYLLLILTVLHFSSCERAAFLEEKPSSNIIVPKTPEDFQKILDYYDPQATGLLNSTGAFGEISSDNFYLQSASWNALNTIDKNAYIWAKDIYEGSTVEVPDWNYPYIEVYTANVVLEGIAKQLETNPASRAYDFPKGHALFIRAYAFFNLAQHFSLAYDESTAESDLGVPLPLKADVNKTEPRSSLRQTYERITTDLKESSRLITVAQPNQYLNRPCKAAVFAMLSRVYLSMRNYREAGNYADSCLSLYNQLIDYNVISKTSNLPFSRSEKEVLFQSFVPTFASSLLSSSNSISFIDTNLYKSYSDKDLRKAVFFRSRTGGYTIKGGYHGSSPAFTGLAVDETYLTRAECYARQGNVEAAMNDLNTLLIKRWDKSSTYTPLIATGPTEALSIILTERRKELIWRGLRWMDIRRLNKEGHAISLKRRIENVEYVLEPNSLRYALPIPLQEINMSGITQNNR